MTVPDISNDRYPLVTPGAVTPLVTPTVLSVLVSEQDRTNWCWAAVGLGVVTAYGTAGSAEQCNVAARVLNKRCCPNGDGCNEPWPLRCALTPHYANTVDTIGHQIIDYVKKHVDVGHPIAVRVHRRLSGSGHAVVIAGYLETTSENFLWICDPWSGKREPWSFDRFRLRYEQDGVWETSYETKGGSVSKASVEELYASSLA